MKAPRTLNLLVAAAGLVSLTGCSTDTLTDSAFWSYLPFTSSSGGHGSGGQGADAKPRSGDAPANDAAAGQNGDHKPTAKADSEGWNEPAKATKDAPAASDRPTTSAGPAKATASAPAATTPARPPALSVSDRPPTTPRSGGTIALPAPGDAPGRSGSSDPVNFADMKAPKSASPAVAASPSLPTGTDARTKGQRAPVRLPELLVDGIGPATTGRPTLAELPKRTAPAKPSDALNLPEVVTAGTAVAAAPTTNRLPRALTEASTRASIPRASLPLPGLPSDAPASTTRQTLGAPTPSAPAKAPGANDVILGLTPPDAPTVKDKSGATLAAGDVPNGPGAPQSTGSKTPLPDVAAAAPLPPKPIPAPFRLSEWISNDALHQEWRRHQLQRTQTEPAARGGEQQRLRLVLDTYLLREKTEEKEAK